MWANAGMTMTMPSIDDTTDNVCLIDYTERRDIRLKYPGACALEYESIIKTLLKKLFGWDCKKQKGTKGILGTLEAFCVAHEEQSRKTSHGHWLLWIKELMHWRKELFGSNKEAARKAFLKYVDSIMSSSYLKDEEIKVDNDCCNKCESNATMDQCIGSIPGQVDEDGNGHDAMGPCTVYDNFVDVDVGGTTSEQEQLQRIRDTRSKHEKDKIRFVEYY